MNRASRRWDRLSFSAMRRLQARRLRRFLRHQVLPFSTYYRRLWRKHDLDARRIADVADLAQLPFTTKRDLADNARDLILKPSPETIRKYLPKTALLRLLARRLLTGDTETFFKVRPSRYPTQSPCGEKNGSCGSASLFNSSLASN